MAPRIWTSWRSPAQQSPRILTYLNRVIEIPPVFFDLVSITVQMFPVLLNVDLSSILPLMPKIFIILNVIVQKPPVILDLLADFAQIPPVILDPLADLAQIPPVIVDLLADLAQIPPDFFEILVRGSFAAQMPLEPIIVAIALLLVLLTLCLTVAVHVSFFTGHLAAVSRVTFLLAILTQKLGMQTDAHQAGV